MWPSRNSPPGLSKISSDVTRRKPPTTVFIVTTTSSRTIRRPRSRPKSTPRAGFTILLKAIDPATLSLDQELDRQTLLWQMDDRVLQLEVVRRWANDPDYYSSEVTNAAYVTHQASVRPGGSAEEPDRRERTMPAALEEARVNLENPPRVFTQIALEQIDGNISFFKNDVPAAFTRRDRRGAARRFDKTQRRGHRRARRLQDVPAERPAAEVERELRARRRHVCEGARRQ